jgi:transcription elongation GreA/GreB family factor
MSRAFTKEVDDAPVAPPLDRPISTAQNLVTPRGAELILAKVAELDSAIRRATNQSKVDVLRREQRYWAARQATMRVVPAVESPTAISFGVTAKIRRRGKPTKIRIVGEDEADPSLGLIAWTSPLALALDGAEPGEVIEFGGGGHTEQIAVVEVAP